MVEVVYPQEDGKTVRVDLRDPYWAALLAWLWPGAGHFYQRRYGKGLLFMVCILSIFIFGLCLGRGRVVYASFERGDFRWQYVCQLGAGLVALPAVVQAIKTRDGGDPFLVMCQRYPEGSGLGKSFRQIPPDVVDSGLGLPKRTYKDGFMAPPAGPIDQNEVDVLGMWHFEMKHMYEMGTLYCVIAGLLNLLAIYDAFTGPAILTEEEKEKIQAKKKKKAATDPQESAGRETRRSRS